MYIYALYSTCEVKHVVCAIGKFPGYITDDYDNIWMEKTTRTAQLKRYNTGV